jgi:hypothetical protein
VTGFNLTHSGCSSNYGDLSSTPAALSGLLHCGIMVVKCRMIHCALCVCRRIGMYTCGELNSEALVCVCVWLKMPSSLQQWVKSWECDILGSAAM